MQARVALRGKTRRVHTGFLLEAAYGDERKLMVVGAIRHLGRTVRVAVAVSGLMMSPTFPASDFWMIVNSNFVFCLLQKLQNHLRQFR